MPKPIPTSTPSTTILPVSTARQSAIPPRPAGALCNAELRKQVANIGEDPTPLPRTYAKLLNAAIKDRPRDMTVCMHLCRGNFAGAWVADGAYEPIAELIFNEINMDGYFLEYDSARAGGFEPLRFLPR